MKPFFLKVSILYIIALFLGGCASSQWNVYEKEVLGTLVQLKLVGDSKKTQAVSEKIFKKLAQIEKTTNLIDPTSEISQLNHQRKMQVTSDLFYILKHCLDYAWWSQGAFDPTVGAMTLAYRIGENKKTPSAAELKKILQSVNYKEVILDSQNNVVILNHPQAQLDVWGAVKGYAADQILKMLKESHIQAGLIDLGGQVTVWGKHPTRGEWRVGIEDPHDPKNILKIVSLKSGQTLSTSSGSQRVNPNNSKQHHIFDPYSGNSPHQFLSVTIIADQGIDADILSTAVFVMKTIQPLKQLKSVQYVVLDHSGKLLVN